MKSKLMSDQEYAREGALNLQYGVEDPKKQT